MDPRKEVQQIPMGVLRDIAVLYRTLVADGGLPPGYDKEFSSLGPVLDSAVQRQDGRLHALSNMEGVHPREAVQGTGREARQRCEDIGGSVSVGGGQAASQVYVPFAT